MISRTVKIQLAFFVAITLVGCAFVGARYAQLDRLVTDQSYTVWRTSTPPAASSPVPR